MLLPFSCISNPSLKNQTVFTCHLVFVRPQTVAVSVYSMVIVLCLLNCILLSCVFIVGDGECCWKHQKLLLYFNLQLKKLG